MSAATPGAAELLAVMPSDITSSTNTIVASLFVRLPQKHAKHAYAFQYKGFQLAVDVPAEYDLWGSAIELEQISKARTDQGHATVTHPVEFEFVSKLVARRLGVSTEQLLRAAERSVTPRHCPSAELIVLWLSKPLIVELAMQVPSSSSSGGGSSSSSSSSSSCCCCCSSSSSSSSSSSGSSGSRG